MKNKGFMLLETLIASTVILGALIFLYAQFSAIKRTFNTSFKYNTIPGLYEAKTLANFLENDGYALYINELSNSDKGYLDINDCHNSRSSLCRKILNNIDAKNVLFVSDNISTLQNDLSINNYDKSIFNEDFKNFILTMNTIENQGRYQLIISYKDNTFASIPIGVSNADEQKIQYQVNHYLMSTDGSSYELKETDEYTWFKGYEITPEVNNYTGFTSPESQTIILTDDTKEVNYYYDRNKYTVTITGDEHVTNIEGNGIHYYGENITINVSIDIGYSIDTISGDFNTLEFTMPAKDIAATILTKFVGFEVTFDVNGGTSIDENIIVAYGEEYGSLPTPIRSGYGFAGWYTAKSGGTRITSDTIVDIADNHTLYAHWANLTFTITGGRYDETGACYYNKNYGSSKTFNYGNYKNCKIQSGYSCGDKSCSSISWYNWYGWGSCFKWNDAGQYWDCWGPLEGTCKATVVCQSYES